MKKQFKNTHPSPWNRTSNVRLLAEILVHNVVLTAHNHTAWTVVSARDANQVVAAFGHRFGVFTHHMVQSQIQLVKRQRLLNISRGRTGRVVIGVLLFAKLSNKSCGEFDKLKFDIYQTIILYYCKTVIKIKHHIFKYTQLINLYPI